MAELRIGHVAGSVETDHTYLRRQKGDDTVKPKHIVLAVVAVLVIVIVVVTSQGGRAGETQTVGDVKTLFVSSANADSEVARTITLLEGQDADHESAHIFEVVELAGVEKVALNLVTLELVVSYDSALISEGQITQALATAGYIQ